MFTLGDIPRLGALHYFNREAVIFEDVRLTYRQLNDRINRLSQAISGMGYRRGDRVAILSENSHKYLEVYFAVSKLGMNLIPLNCVLPDADLIRVINTSDASLLIAEDRFADRIDQMHKDLMSIQHRVLLDHERPGYLHYEALLEAAPADEPQVPVDENEMVMIAYKNGMKTVARGVMLSHRNIMTTAKAIAGMLDLSADDSGCFVLPFYQTEIFNVFSMMMAGGKVAIQRSTDPGAILRLIQKEKCTHINLVPTMYNWLQQYPALDKYDISSIRVMLYTGSPFAPKVLEQCVRKFWKRFAQFYGSTETSGRAVTFLNSDDHVLEGPRAKLLSSAGKPCQCAEVRVFDDNDRPVKPRQVGEVVVKGQNVMLGYWKDPELTRHTLRNGWLHTQDLGYMDEDGYLYVLGRRAQQQAA
jgi:long-chain acyl-CoA synthetase